jgi:Flp pilus assembly protein TadG
MFESAFYNFEAGRATIQTKTIEETKQETVLKIKDIMDSPFNKNSLDIANLTNAKYLLNATINRAKNIPIAEQTKEISKTIKEAQNILKK